MTISAPPPPQPSHPQRYPQHQSVDAPVKQTWRQRLHGYGLPPRIVALDIARGLAVLGMLAAHTVDFPDTFVWTKPSTWTAIVDGRSSILFALLAGISVALMTGRQCIPIGSELLPLRMKLIARGLVIFAIGLALEMLGTPIAVILCLYGVVYAIATLFIGVRVRTLLIWAGCLALAGPTAVGMISLFGADGDGFTFLFQGTYSAVVWVSLLLGGMALGRMDITRKKVATWGLVLGVACSAVGYGVGTATDHLYDGSSSYGSSDEGSSLSPGDKEGVPGEDVDLKGKVCDVYDGNVDCYPKDEYMDFDEDSVSSLGGSYTSLDEDGSEGWFAYAPGEDMEAGEFVDTLLYSILDSSAHSGGTMEILGSGGFALALVCLLVLTGHRLRHVLLPLAAIGSMPLSAYSAHVLIIYALTGSGGGEQPGYLFWLIAAFLWVACSVWALLWGKGPLERLMVAASKRMVPSS